jgi:hypothetical protein
VRRRLGLGLALGCALSLAAASAAAEPEATDGLTGRDIYARVVANRFRSFSQTARLRSVDRAGRSQETRFVMHWMDFRSEDSGPTPGVVSRTLVKYTHPFDLRHAGYLIQVNDGRPNDQFVYSPSRRKVVRVNLRSEAVYGTDFSFEDVIPRELGDFSYRRAPDRQEAGDALWVVDLTPRPHVDSDYSKIRVYVDRERHLVVRARYWDQAGLAIKEFEAAAPSIREFDGVWVPLESTMRNLVLDTHTTLLVTELLPDPGIDRTTFDLGRLESH